MTEEANMILDARMKQTDTLKKSAEVKFLLSIIIHTWITKCIIDNYLKTLLTRVLWLDSEESNLHSNRW